MSYTVDINNSGGKRVSSVLACLDHNYSTVMKIVDELSAIDSELCGLFSDKINTSSIYSIQLYRGRIAKRIASYDKQLKHLQHYYEITPFSESKRVLSSLYHKHSTSLSRYKSNLNDWWLGIENKFNQLCLTSFVSETNHNKSVARHAKLEEKLFDTKKMMLSLDSQMQAAESSILKSSEYINEQEAFYKAFKNHLSKASSLLSQLHYRTSKRKNFIYTCLFFQLAVCAIIILRRLSIIRIALWLISIIFKIIKLPFYVIGPFLRSFIISSRMDYTNGDVSNITNSSISLSDNVTLPSSVPSTVNPSTGPPHTDSSIHFTIKDPSLSTNGIIYVPRTPSHIDTPITDIAVDIESIARNAEM